MGEIRGQGPEFSVGVRTLAAGEPEVPSEDPSDHPVDHGEVTMGREDRHGVRSVWPDSGQLQEVLGF